MPLQQQLNRFYLPSKNELEFVNNKLNHGFFIPEVFKSMNSGTYLTSTPYFEMQSSTKYDLDSQIFNFLSSNVFFGDFERDKTFPDFTAPHSRFSLLRCSTTQKYFSSTNKIVNFKTVLEY